MTKPFLNSDNLAEMKVTKKERKLIDLIRSIKEAPKDHPLKIDIIEYQPYRLSGPVFSYYRLEED